MYHTSGYLVLSLSALSLLAVNQSNPSKWSNHTFFGHQFISDVEREKCKNEAERVPTLPRAQPRGTILYVRNFFQVVPLVF
jgi:hypothetical protein